MLKAFLSPRGRRSRVTYWRAAAVVPSLTMVLALSILIASGSAGFRPVSTISVVVVVVVVVGLWAGLAVGIQRLHDRDLSGWWVLLALVPVGGSVWYLFWNGLRPGTPGPNRFGPDPSVPHAAVAAVFDDGSAPKSARRPLVSTVVAWIVLVLVLGLYAVLFQNPERQTPYQAPLSTDR